VFAAFRIIGKEFPQMQSFNRPVVRGERFPRRALREWFDRRFHAGDPFVSKIQIS
jgi:hypothetical protein